MNSPEEEVFVHPSSWGEGYDFYVRRRGRDKAKVEIAVRFAEPFTAEELQDEENLFKRCHEFVTDTFKKKGEFIAEEADEFFEAEEEELDPYAVFDPRILNELDEWERSRGTEEELDPYAVFDFRILNELDDWERSRGTIVFELFYWHPKQNFPRMFRDTTMQRMFYQSLHTDLVGWITNYRHPEQLQSKSPRSPARSHPHNYPASTGQPTAVADMDERTTTAPTEILLAPGGEKDDHEAGRGRLSSSTIRYRPLPQPASRAARPTAEHVIVGLRQAAINAQTTSAYQLQGQTPTPIRRQAIEQSSQPQPSAKENLTVFNLKLSLQLASYMATLLTLIAWLMSFVFHWVNLQLGLGIVFGVCALYVFLRFAHSQGWIAKFLG
ncbi:MAG TPA: hypothetical protein VNG90_04955 [Candidatus Acidoferrum sp.]|nr:hypothetical protein [Candidatus Acidoferrum sp.]